jgi:hypothetical protein
MKRAHDVVDRMEDGMTNRMDTQRRMQRSSDVCEDI